MNSSEISRLLLTQSELELASPAELAEYSALLERLDLVDLQESARDLKSFALSAWGVLEPAQEFHWNWHLDYVVEHLQLVRTGKCRRLIINIPPQSTKALALDTQIPTPTGMRLIRDIHPGDIVFGSDGHPTTVIAESEIFTDHECYELEFKTGERVVADAGHLWETTARQRAPLSGKSGPSKGSRFFGPRGTCGYRVKPHVFREATAIRTTDEISKTLKGPRDTNRKNARNNHSVRVASPIVCSEKPYLIHPYVLGAWLGDGTSKGAEITVGDDEIVSEIAATGEHIYFVSRHRDTNCSLYHLGENLKGCWRGPRAQTGFRSRLRSLGVFGNKHIPEQYFLGSIDQRTELLRGLMDTDGCAAKNGELSFSNMNKRLASDVKRLVCSLGFKGRLRTTPAILEGKKVGDSWLAKFCAYRDFRVFRLKRKSERQRIHSGRSLQNCRYISAARKIQPCPVKCIQVSARDGMFLITDGYIPTHNSRLVTVFFPAWWWSSDPSRRFLSASYSGGAMGLATLHSLERRRVLDSDWFKKTFPGLFAWTQFTQQQYENDCGGRMVATSTGATATGKGFHCLILDDLLNPKKAESDTERQTAIKFVDQTLRSRLSDQVTGSIIVVEQRLHEQDVTGHLMELEPGAWTHIKIPMVAEEDEVWKFPISGRVVKRKKNELLWPRRFPQAVVDSLKIGMGSRAWGAQYQQRPSPAEGIIFNPSHWRYFVNNPENAHDDVTVAPAFDDGAITVDCAFKETADSDNVALQLWAFVGNRNYMVRKDTCRRGYTATKLAIREMKIWAMKNHVPCNYALIEDKANGSAVIEEFKRDTKMGMSIIAVEPLGGKIARAWAAQPEQEAGNCYLPEDDDETPKFVGDCAKFPVIDKDDDVDAFTQLVNWRRMRSHGLIELWKQQAEEAKKGAKKLERDKAPTDEQVQAGKDAQMKEAADVNPAVSSMFGATKMKVAVSRDLAKPLTNSKTEACPECGNTVLGRSGVPGNTTQGEIEVKCKCGWSKIEPR